MGDRTADRWAGRAPWRCSEHPGGHPSTMDVPDEIIETPMKNVKPPAVLEVPERSSPTITCGVSSRVWAPQSSSFGMTFLRVLCDCGARSAEVTGLHVGVVDWDRQVVDVVGEERRPRVISVRDFSMWPNRVLVEPAPDSGPITDRGERFTRMNRNPRTVVLLLRQ